MKQNNRSSERKLQNVFWLVSVLMISFMLSGVIRYAYQNYCNRVTADAVSVTAMNISEDGLQYQEISVSPENNEDVSVKLDGMLPVAAEVVVESGDTAQQDTVCAYDITISDMEGKSFQPSEDSPITVEITDSVISEYDKESLHLWHIDDAGIREEVKDFTVEGDSVIFTATGFSIYEISSGEPNLCTYEFYTLNNDEEYKKYYYITSTGKQICEQVIKDTDTLVTPHLPAWEKNEGNAEEPHGKTFLGWYILEGEEGSLHATDVMLDFHNPNNFTSGGTVRVGAVFAECAYLIFHDQYNSKINSYPIVGTRRGTLENGTTTISTRGIEVSYDDESTDETKVTHMVFDGWSRINVAPGETAKKLEDTITISANTNVYPLFRKVAWLSFSTGQAGSGSESVQPISKGVDEGTAQLAVPSRTGYNFAGWYTDEDCTVQVAGANGSVLSGNYNLTDTLEIRNGSLYVTGDSKLYAKWTEGTANYTIVIWRQKVTDAADNNVDNNSYDYAESVQRTATTGSSVGITYADQHKSGEDYTGFSYSHCDTAKTVAADGSTVLNVYYDRNPHTFTFQTREVDRRGRETFTTIHTADALYGSDISGIWEFDGLDGHHYPRTDVSTNTSWTPSGSAIYTTRIMQMLIMPDEDITFTYTTSNNEKRYFHYYVEARPDAENTRTYKNTEYEPYSDRMETVITDFNYIYYNDEYFELNGFERFEAATANGTTVSISVGGTSWQTSWNKNLYFYYTRKSYNLDFMDSESSQIFDQHSVKYQYSLAEFDDFIPPAPNGKEFTGWYVDSDCKIRVFFHTPTQEEIDALGGKSYQVYDTMPANNLPIYAGWEPIHYLIEIDPNGGVIDSDDNSGGTTWMWKTYGQTFNEYTWIRRDYEPSARGTYYYQYLNREAYDLGHEYVPGEEAFTDRSATYTTDISGNGVDLRQKYKYSPGAYSYADWYKVEPDGTETLYSFDTPVTGDVYLRLHWKALGTYYIEYNPAGGILDSQDENEIQFKKLDDSDYADKARVVITRTVVTPPTGTNFIGWRLRNDPSGTIYYPGGAFEFDSTFAETVTDEHGDEKKYMVLDAVYQAFDEPSIIYDANGGNMTANADPGSGTFLKNVTQNPDTLEFVETELSNAEKYSYNVDAGRLTVFNLVNNTQITLSSGEGFSFTYNGVSYELSGWNTRPDGQGTHFELGSNAATAYPKYYLDTDPDDPVTLYAEWKTRVYFDKNNDDADWGVSEGTRWDPEKYTWDEAAGMYYQEIYLNDLLNEPSYIPVSHSTTDNKMFQYWSPTRYTTFDDNSPFDFSQPVTQERIEAIKQSAATGMQDNPYLILYGIWNTPIEIKLHAVDSTHEELALKDNNLQADDWRYTDHFLINSNTEIDLADYDDAKVYVDPKRDASDQADYKYVFVCVSDSLNHVAEENAITKIWYNTGARHVYVTYADGREEPLPDDKEFYFVYYTYPSKVPVGYVEMETNGNLTNVAVITTAPKIADVDAAYKMQDNLSTPQTYPTASTPYSYYSYAIGDKNATDSSMLHIITAASTTDVSRPNLWVQDTWRGFKYSTDNGQTWIDAGYDIELYVVYYEKEPTIVNLHEKTIGYPEDMDKEFHYNVEVSEHQETVSTRQYYYKKGNGNSESAYQPLPANATIYPSDTSYYNNPFGGTLNTTILQSGVVPGSEHTIASEEVYLSDGKEESFTLFYSENNTSSTNFQTASYKNGNSTDNSIYYYDTASRQYYQIYRRDVTKNVTTQTIEIVQARDPDFETSMEQNPNRGTIDEPARKYTYTATSENTTQNVTYINTHTPIDVEVHVAIARGDGYFEHDDYRTQTESHYKDTLPLGDSMILLDEFPSGTLLNQAMTDRDDYVFAGIVYGKRKSESDHRLDVEGTGITKLTYGRLDEEEPNVYDRYLNDDKQKLLNGYELYYVYYKRPKICYCYEDGKGRLTLIDPIERNHAEVSLNSQTVAQNQTLPIDGNQFINGGDFLISQSANCYQVPPDLDYAGVAMAIEYDKIGVGVPGVSKLKDLESYTEIKELRLKAEDGILKYRYNSTDAYTTFAYADDMVIYAIYKGGNKLTVSKTIEQLNTDVGYPTFQFRIKQVKDFNGTVISPDNGEEYVISLKMTSTGTMSSDLLDLPLGYYEVTELSNVNYTRSENVIIYPEQTEGGLQGGTATVVLGPKTEIAVRYANTLNQNDKKTYQTFADNEVKYGNP